MAADWNAPAPAQFVIYYRAMAEDRDNYEAAKRLIAGAKRILLSGHLSPDGDALGSMLAMARLLTNAGYEAFATADLNALGKLAFLDGVDRIIPVRKLKRRKFDLFIALDCSGFNRMPPEVKPPHARRR